MTILSILEFPNPKLKLVAKQINEFDANLRSIYEDMLETMYNEDGLGLAATQVGIGQRIFVADVSPDKNNPICFINPEIIAKSGEVIWEEGCLSFPNIYARVKRHAQISLRFQDLDGVEQTLDAADLFAVCIQHELDHLNGITFFDHLSPLKQRMIRKKLIKQRDEIL